MARKPPVPNPPAKTKTAKVKPGSGAEPASENTQGLITPKTEPNVPGKPTNPPVKPETLQEKSLLEKAGELIKKGEIEALVKLKEEMAGAIDAAVEASGYSVPAMVAGAIGKAVVVVLAPDNVIDAVPGLGKLGSAGSKVVKAGERAGEAAAKDAVKGAAKKETEKVAEGAAKEGAQSEAKAAGKEAQAANGGGGGFNKSTKRPPRHRCELMKYKDMICDGEKHHVVPDFVLRTGSSALKEMLSTRIPGTPAYEDGPAICLSKDQHSGLHRTMNQQIQSQGVNGTISAGQVKHISATEAAKHSGCNPKNIKKQLDQKMKMPDDKQLRAVVDSRKVTQDIVNKVNGKGDF